MLEEYVEAQSSWLTPAHMPLVFHLRKLCVRLDAAPDAPAAFSSAYLQTFSRLDKHRPGATSAPSDPDQTTIFDHID